MSKPKLKKSFGKPERRWDATIETDLDEVGRSGLERIQLF
jgi:hypothetical protein